MLKNNKLLFLGFSIVLGIFAVLVQMDMFGSRKTSNKWSAIVFNSGDNGLVHLDFFNQFSTVDECLRHAESVLKSRTPLQWENCKNECFGNNYFCGMNCKVQSEFGSVFASEIQCDEKKFLSTPPKL